MGGLELELELEVERELAEEEPVEYSRSMGSVEKGRLDHRSEDLRSQSDYLLE